jgi:phosphatidate cytidylyltransferase
LTEPNAAPSANQNLLMRVITALVAAPLILVLLYLGPAWAWALFIGVATAIGAFELFSMTHEGDRVAQIAGVALCLAVFLALWFFTTEPRALLMVFLVVPLASQLLALARLGDMKTAALRMTSTTFAPLWVGAGMASLALLKRDAGADGPGFVLLSLMLSWFSDTGAYFAGRFLGKRKLYPAVSPKKTIAGAFGGLAGAIAGALAGSFLYLRSLPVLDGLALAIIAGGLGQLGDLGESLLKRSVGVKDSGGIVPGHGGILDRVDALLVTAGFAYAYVLWVR